MFENLVITFKNGEIKTYSKGEWNDYRYDGKTISVIKEVGNSAPTIALFNIDVICCVELI